MTGDRPAYLGQPGQGRAGGRQLSACSASTPGRTMSRGLSSRNVALCDQILAVLTDDAPLPVPTGHVWRKISPHRPRADRLAALARREYATPAVPSTSSPNPRTC